MKCRVAGYRRRWAQGNDRATSFEIHSVFMISCVQAENTDPTSTMPSRKSSFTSRILEKMWDIFWAGRSLLAWQLNRENGTAGVCLYLTRGSSTHEGVASASTCPSSPCSMNEKRSMPLDAMIAALEASVTTISADLAFDPSMHTASIQMVRMKSYFRTRQSTSAELAGIASSFR